MRELLTTSNDPTGLLRTVCKPVENINSEVKALAYDLIDYMLAHNEDEICPIGLSAPQLGSSIRVIAFYPNPRFRERSAIQVLVNPELVKMSKYSTCSETCLSVPGETYQLRRAEQVKIKGLNLDGQPRTFKGVYLLAQVFQHEIDHLNGVLIGSIREPVGDNNE